MTEHGTTLLERMFVTSVHIYSRQVRVVVSILEDGGEVYEKIT